MISTSHIRPWIHLATIALLLSACGGTLEDGAPSDAVQQRLSGTRLRLVAANLSSGNNQSYEAPGSRIMQGLHPDVVMLQEFNVGDNSEDAIRGWVDDTFGSSFSYTRGPAAQIPNGVISRYPILASGDWTDPEVSNRDFVWARIDVPGTKDLWVVSVHLLTSSSSKRASEASALLSRLQANVPVSDLLAIGGDFNTTSIARRSETGTLA
jgi:endonuclease/exonuclease/phosphatase family metal-dependent hydrolase